MGALRPEIQAFIRASETLLSPASLDRPLTQDEMQVVAYYAKTLAKQYASVREVGDLS